MIHAGAPKKVYFFIGFFNNDVQLYWHIYNMYKLDSLVIMFISLQDRNFTHESSYIVDAEKSSLMSSFVCVSGNINRK